MRLATLVVTLTLGLGTMACIGGGDVERADADGARVAVGVAALGLSGVTDALWRLEVAACAVDGEGACTGAPGEVVFDVTVTSSAFGDGAGSATYVGPCDATSHQNLVSIELLELLGPGGAPLSFEDPGVMSRWAECVANADTRVDFQVTVLRPAQQGFLDLAVNFNAIFCSAKYDCTAHDLLHDPTTGERARTQILGFACASGLGAGHVTELYLADLVITCAADEVVLTLPPAGQDGNQGPVAHEATPWLTQWATFSGEEQLPGLDKRYYNVALGVADTLPAGCTLATRGTADDQANATLVDGAVPAGVVYPYITWAIDDLQACATVHPVNGAESGVQTAYTETTTEGQLIGKALFSPPTGTYALGGVVTEEGGYRVHTFLDPSEAHTFEVVRGGEVEVLIVGGGGGGGDHSFNSGTQTGGGGGGAGGLVYYGPESPRVAESFSVETGEVIPVAVGAGGARGSSGRGHNGQASSFGAVVAQGGGGGGGRTGQEAGAAGGSGGGAGYSASPGAGVPGQGHGGGGAYSPAANYGGGGGGGAGSLGGTAPQPAGGVGGAGLAYAISGVLTHYAGGGGGGVGNYGTEAERGLGGLGGGGHGGYGEPLSDATDGLPNTGGGGGGSGRGGNLGGSSPWSFGGDGGAGVVIVRYPYP